jgi:hypothetical protein
VISLTACCSSTEVLEELLDPQDRQPIMQYLYQQKALLAQAQQLQSSSRSPADAATTATRADPARTSSGSNSAGPGVVVVKTQQPLQPSGVLSQTHAGMAVSGRSTGKGMAGDVEVVMLGKPRSATTLVKPELVEDLHAATPAALAKSPAVDSVPAVTKALVDDSMHDDTDQTEVLVMSSSTMPSSSTPTTAQQPTPAAVVQPLRAASTSTSVLPPPPVGGAQKRKAVDSKLFIRKQKK